MSDELETIARKLLYALRVQFPKHEYAADVVCAIDRLIQERIKEATPDILRAAGVRVKP